MAAKDLKELVAEELETKERKTIQTREKIEKEAERQRHKEERAQQKLDAIKPKEIKRLSNIFEQVTDKQIAAALSSDQLIIIKLWRGFDNYINVEAKETSGYKALQKRLALSFAEVSNIAIYSKCESILTANVVDLITGNANIRDSLVISLEWDKDKFLEQTEKQKKLEIM